MTQPLPSSRLLCSRTLATESQRADRPPRYVPLLLGVCGWLVGVGMIYVDKGGVGLVAQYARTWLEVLRWLVFDIWWCEVSL